MVAPLVVPDASVILKWVLPPASEPDFELALALRDAIASGVVHARVPSLWIYEVGNMLARERPRDASQLLEPLLRFGLTSAPQSSKWLARTLDLTRHYGVAFYDAAYHAHAIIEQGLLITVDERYVAAAGDAGFVMRLSEWEGGLTAKETRE